MPLSPTRLPSPYDSDRLVRLAARLWPALCDTMITVGSQEFPAHSLVLAGVSQQLGHRGHWTLVKGISPSTFAQLLYFVYGESVELQPGELGPLEEAARALGVQCLEEACRKARRDRARVELSQELKEHQEEPERPTKDSERGVGGLGEQKPEKFIRTGGREQETIHHHRPLRESPEIAEAVQESQGEQMRSEEILNQSLVDHRGVDGKQEVIMWVRESPGGSEESLGELPGPRPHPGSLQTSITSRPWWAEAPWLGEGQPALWRSFLLLPQRYGTPFSRSTPINGAWQEVWPQDQRIPLSLHLHKGLWNQNQLAFSRPTSGSLPQSPAKLSPEEMEESDQRYTGALATCVGPVGKEGRSSRQRPPLPPARSRPYSCSVCGKRFSLKHQMETHYRVHTGEKPFSCSLCPQRSRDFSAMTKHLRTHGAAPYRCPLCGAGCPSLASMQAHMRGHSPSQLPPGWTIRSTFLYSSTSRPSRASTSL
ncbi:zinc finger and BTB domain-containing protein 32 isoform X2 [Desmodus rotundus]|uniref:zinc finger and BTB domain-containing protein 32 isoform X2 n=1 Tax=Desmodus rotundus TaxID=9430 RepID=UPI000D17F056|nr:zinc finger and BTB domain-containing protein 32 isoform X2 [Desmodus rotundus]